MKILWVRIIFSIAAMALAACTGMDRGAVEPQASLVNAFTLETLAQERPSALIEIAEAFEASGDYLKAFQFYEKILSHWPDNRPALQHQARLLSRFDRKEEALDILQKLLQTDKNDPSLLEDYIRLLVSLGRFENANMVVEDFFERVALLDGDPAISFNNNAESEEITKLVKISNPPTALLLLAAKLNAVRGDFVHAENYLQKITEKGERPETIHMRALMHALDGRYEMAVALLQPLLNEPSQKALGRDGLATVYALSGQLEASAHIAASYRSGEELKNMSIRLKILSKLEKKDQALLLFFDYIDPHSLPLAKE